MLSQQVPVRVFTCFPYRTDFLAAGLEHVAGDFFQSVPRGDAVWMKVNNTLLYQSEASACRFRFKCFRGCHRMDVHLKFDVNC